MFTSDEQFSNAALRHFKFGPLVIRGYFDRATHYFNKLVLQAISKVSNIDPGIDQLGVVFGNATLGQHFFACNMCHWLGLGRAVHYNKLGIWSNFCKFLNDIPRYGSATGGHATQTRKCNTLFKTIFIQSIEQRRIQRQGGYFFTFYLCVKHIGIIVRRFCNIYCRQNGSYARRKIVQRKDWKNRQIQVAIFVRQTCINSIVLCSKKSM